MSGERLLTRYTFHAINAAIRAVPLAQKVREEFWERYNTLVHLWTEGTDVYEEFCAVRDELAALLRQNKQTEKDLIEKLQDKRVILPNGKRGIVTGKKNPALIPGISACSWMKEASQSRSARGV